MRRAGHPIAIGAGGRAPSRDPDGKRAAPHNDVPWTVRSAFAVGPDCAAAIVPVALLISTPRVVPASA
jgi:hypothetical protein